MINNDVSQQHRQLLSPIVVEGKDNVQHRNINHNIDSISHNVAWYVPKDQSLMLL